MKTATLFFTTICLIIGFCICYSFTEGHPFQGDTTILQVIVMLAFAFLGRKIAIDVMTQEV